jgi:type IV pilus assembly protein PilA
VKRCPICQAIYPKDHHYCAADGVELISAPAGKRRIPVFVWVLVGVAAFFFILMLIGIRTALFMRMHFHELSAKKTIQTIQQAEQMYADTYPASGFSCSLAALGGDPHSGPPTAASAQLLPDDLTNGHHAGYVFRIGNCTKSSSNGSQRITGYQITAVPDTEDDKGKPGYCSDDGGAIKKDPSGGTNCTQIVQ